MKFKVLFLVPLILAIAACGGPTYRSRVLETPGSRDLKPWERPYEVNGKRYEPLRGGEHAGYVEEGLASWYGRDFHGKRTSNGEVYDMHAPTAAHKTLPLGVYVKVHNLANGREAVARINDRGPFVKGRIIDLSYALASELEVVGPGTAPVRIEALGFRQTDSAGHATYRQPASYTTGSYAVQVGAFTIRDNAERLAQQLKMRYGNAAVQEGWVGSRLFYRVRAGRYASVQAAETARAGFETGGYPSSFVVALE